MNINEKFFYLFVFCMVITGFSTAISQNNDPPKNPAAILIKDGEYLPQAEIKEILPWGFFIDSSKAINYRVVSKITTKSKFVVDELSKNIDSLKVDFSEDAYTIDFSDAKIKYKWKPDTNGNAGFNERSIVLFSSLNQYEKFGVSVYFFPKFLYNVGYINFNASGNYFDYDDILTSGAYFEIGGAIKSDFVDILFGFGHGYKAIYHHHQQLYILNGPNSIDLYPEVSYIELTVRAYIVPKRIFTFFSFRNYITDFTIDGGDNNNILKFGLGYSI